MALFAQNAESSFPSYVVIGAFTYQQNAVQFTDEARRNNFPARFEMNPNRNLYYVYILSTTDKEHAVAEALRLRAETKYFDTWVYSGVLGKMDLTGPPQREDQDVDPVTGQTIARVSPDEDQTSTQRSLSRHAATVTGQQGNQKASPGNDRSADEIAAKEQSANDANMPRDAARNGDKNAGTSTSKNQGQPSNTLPLNSRQDVAGDESAGETTDGSALTQRSDPSLQDSNSKRGSVKAKTSAQKTSKNSGPPTEQQTQLQAQHDKGGKQSTSQNNPVQNVNAQETALVTNKSSQKSERNTLQGQSTKPTGSDGTQTEPEKNEGTDVAAQQERLSAQSNPSSDAQSTAPRNNNGKQNATTGKTGNDKKTVVASNENLSTSQKGLAADQQKAKSGTGPSQRTGLTQEADNAQGAMADADKTDGAPKQDQLSGKSSPSLVQSTASRNTTSAKAGSENKIVAAGNQNLSGSQKDSGNRNEKANDAAGQNQRVAQAQQLNDAQGDMADGDKTDGDSKQDQVSGKSNPSPVQSTASKNSTKQNTTSGKAGSEKKTVAAGKENLSQSAGKTALVTEESSASIPPPVRKTTAPLSPEEVVGKNFYFHLFRGDNLNTVPGEVEAIDFEKSRKMATYPANEGVKVIIPSGKTKHISFVCQVFGYRKQQQEYDPASPSENLYLDDKGNLVVPFELIRLQKGDIAIMYNVFFFKDAALMRPESRYEVNNLLDLLKENPTYKIMIHGHTNGNASGKIIRMDKTGNFYSLSGTKQGFGSAKQLSEERALLIREFLISSGISADRMDVKAWGGKKPIHDKHSARAHENVRVEIEILSE